MIVCSSRAIWARTASSKANAVAAGNDTTPSSSPTTMSPGDITEPPIETGTMMQVPFGGAVGNRYATDEHAFNPQRARVKSGTRVMFVNNGRLTHTLAADDGSWKSGLLGPARSFYVTFDKPGTYQYHCTDHPWAIGLVTVEQ